MKRGNGLTLQREISWTSLKGQENCLPKRILTAPRGVTKKEKTPEGRETNVARAVVTILFPRI